MILSEDLNFIVSQGFFSGWRVVNRFTGAISLPNRLLKMQIGLVWMQVRRTKKGASLDSDLSEHIMFANFAKAVADPTSEEGLFWANLNPDELADHYIEWANRVTRDARATMNFTGR